MLNYFRIEFEDSITMKTDGTYLSQSEQSLVLHLSNVSGFLHLFLTFSTLLYHIILNYSLLHKYGNLRYAFDRSNYKFLFVYKLLYAGPSNAEILGVVSD